MFDYYKNKETNPSLVMMMMTTDQCNIYVFVSDKGR